MAGPRPKAVICPMGNTGSSCKHTHTHTSFLTDHETWVQSKDKNMVFCAVWQLHGQKTWTTTIAWINVFVDWSYFWGAFWWNMVLWSRALKSTLPVTYQQDFSKEAAGSLKSNMAYGEAQQCILSFNVKKVIKKKKSLYFSGNIFQMISVTSQIKQHGHLVITILATN